MEKFKPTVIAKEFITAASDALVTQNTLVFNDGVGSSTILTDDQALNNNYKNSQSISKDVPTSVSGYKNVDTNTIVANVKISNKTLSADVRISTILIYASYNGNDILAATARLNAPELLPAYDTDKGTPVTLEFAVYMQVSNNINAPVQFNEAGLATSADLRTVDASAVHIVGDEKIDGTKTFLKPINGTAEITIHYLWDDLDLNTLVSNSVYVANNVKVLQSSGKENFIMRVEAGNSKFPVKQTKYSFDTGITSVRYQNNGLWTNFIKQPTDDSVLVHNTGDETVKGTKTFEKSINGNVTGEAAVANYKNNLLPDNSDVASIAVSGYYYARNANGISGLPKEFNAKYFDLSAWVNGSNGFMIIVDDSNNIYFRKRQNGSWQDYTPMPLDATKLPRNDRQETIHETWKFEKDIDGTANYSKQPVLFDIADGTDLNNIKTSGSYSCGTNRVGNAPINNWFSLVVVQNGLFNGVQTLTDTNNGEVYTRTWNNSGSWFSPWEKLSSDSKVVHTGGDETINGKKTFNGVATFNNGIVNKPISMNGVKIDVSELVSGSYNVWQNDISGCPAGFGVVEVFENVSNTLYRFTETDLPDPHIWVQIRNSFGFSGWKKTL